MRGHHRDWISGLRKFRDGLCVAVQHRFPGHAVVIRFEGKMCPASRSGDLRRQFTLLREAGHGCLDRAPWYLRGLVEVQRGVLGTEDLLDALLVVEAADPDLRAVRQLDIVVCLVKPNAQSWEAELEHLGDGVRPDAGLGVVEPETEDRVPAARRVDGALDDGADQKERFARARAAAKHDVARGASE